MTSSSPTSGTAMAEALVAALAETWRAIQKRHPDVPDVVLTLGSGTIGARRGEVTLGHFAAGRWHATGAEQVAEIEEEAHSGPGIAELFVGGEGLRRGARSVLDTDRTRALRDALTAWLDTRDHRSSSSEQPTTGRTPA